MPIKRSKQTPKARCWIEADGAYVMGDGRARLLDAIDRTGSIARAARDLGISYRHAWGFIRKLESRIGTKIVQTAKGGKGGGGCALLTQTGKTLLRKDLSFRKDVEKAILRTFAKHFGGG